MKRPLIVLLGFCLTSLLWLSIGTARADAQLGGCKPNPNPYNNRQFSQICATGVDSTAMDAAYKVQQTQVWCWAASMEMILAVNSKDISQKDIVTDIFGAAIPVTLPPTRVVPYLNHTYTDTMTNQVATTRSAALYDYRFGASMGALRAIVGQLSQGQPLLVFLPHHAVVMTAIYYYADPNGKPLGVDGVIVRDPFPYEGNRQPVPGIPISGHPGERVLSPQEYFSQLFVFAVSVS